MDVFKTRYYKYSRLQMLLIGQWPYQTKLAAVPIKIFGTFLTMLYLNAEVQFTCIGIVRNTMGSLVMYSLPVIIWFVARGNTFRQPFLLISFFHRIFRHIIKSRHQIQPLVESIPYFLAGAVISVKYLTIWIYSETVKKVMNRIQYDWLNATRNNEDHILKANAEKGWRCCRIYLLTIYPLSSGIFALQFMPEILNMPISLNISRFIQPARGEFFIDQDKYHTVILSYLVLIYIFAAVASTAMTVQWIMIINHACGMFAIFGYRLEHVFRASSGKRARNDKDVKEILVHTVEYHNEITKYVATVNSTYAFYYLPFMIMGITILSTLLVQLINTFTTGCTTGVTNTIAKIRARRERVKVIKDTHKCCM